MKLYKLKKVLDKVLKIELAYKWDNVGLLIGQLDTDITSITTSLELCNGVIEDAIKNKSNMILLHHPLIFSPIKSIVDVDEKQKMIIKLIKNEIALYVAHTNFDILDGGLNDYVMSMLDVTDIEPMLENEDDNIGRVATLKNPMFLKDFARHLESRLDVKNIRIISSTNKKIRKISLVTGSGAEYTPYAMNKSDVFITGDLKYHNAQDLYQMGACVIDANHFDTEKFFTDAIEKFLFKKIPDNIKIHKSSSLLNPFSFVEAYDE